MTLTAITVVMNKSNLLNLDIFNYIFQCFYGIISRFGMELDSPMHFIVDYCHSQYILCNSNVQFYDCK